MTGIKKHIVLLTTWYPPLQSIAVNRMSSIARYLDKEKFELTVITLGTAEKNGPALEDDVQIYRIKPQTTFAKPEFKSTDSRLKHKLKVAWRVLRQRVMGDEDRHYSKHALDYLLNLNESKKIDAIISSFSPVAPHLVALEFVKKNPGVKWVVDMRDEMSLNPQSAESLRTYYAQVEKEINRYAHALTSVSAPIVDYFKTVLPDLRYYEEIRNGFDHDLNPNPASFSEKFTLLHAGSFYGTRKPDTLMQALLYLHRKGKLPANWRFQIVGAARNYTVPAEIAGHIEHLERVSQNESLQLMAKADVNVLIQPPTGRLGVFTGKVFDYLSVCKPVLAVVEPADVAARLILELNAGFVADFNQVEAIEEAVMHAVKLWNERTLLPMKMDQIRQLHRKYQIQKLNLLLEQVLHG